MWKLNQHSKKKNDLECIQNIPVNGVVNKIVESDRFWACAVGQESKHGRWTKVSGAKHGLCIIQKK